MEWCPTNEESNGNSNEHTDDYSSGPDLPSFGFAVVSGLDGGATAQRPRTVDGDGDSDIENHNDRHGNDEEEERRAQHEGFPVFVRFEERQPAPSGLRDRFTVLVS